MDASLRHPDHLISSIISPASVLRNSRIVTAALWTEANGKRAAAATDDTAAQQGLKEWRNKR